MEEMLTELCKIVPHLRGGDGVSLQTQVCYRRTATRIVCYSKHVSCPSPLAKREVNFTPSHSCENNVQFIVNAQEHL